jgi:hypothetical protein
LILLMTPQVEARRQVYILPVYFDSTGIYD